jgi:hypothetical protein
MDMITIKRTNGDKVGVLMKDCNVYVSFMYWFIKYQNYILNNFF